MKRRPKHLFFDFGNTLVDSDTAAADARRATAAAARASSATDISTDEIERLSDRAWASAADEVDRGYYTALGDGPADSQLAAQLVLAGYGRHLLASLDRDPAPALVGILVQTFLDALADDTAFFPGVRETLAHLESAGFRMGIISDNMVEYVDPPLRHLGVADLFDPVIISGREGPGIIKPNPEIFRRALRAAGREASEAMMIGDNLECDIRGAQACGMQAVWVNRPDAAPTAACVPDAIVADLQELPDVLTRATDS